MSKKKNRRPTRKEFESLERAVEQMFAIVETLVGTTKTTSGAVEDISRRLVDEIAGIVALQERQAASRAGRVNH